MINSKYAKAYVEVLEIIKHFPKEEYDKIPLEKINFYKENMDKDYTFVINSEIDLSEQNISPEANAIIVNLFMDYYATEEQKKIIKQILNLNQAKKEQEKIKKYNPNDIFKNVESKSKINDIEDPKYNTNNTSLVEYKESKESIFSKLKNFICKILHIKNHKI